MEKPATTGVQGYLNRQASAFISARLVHVFSAVPFCNSSTNRVSLYEAARKYSA